MSSVQPENRPGAIPALTGLRFFAALFVLISHGLPKILPVSDPTTVTYLYFTYLASIGMPLFFVLSGFVIQYNYASQIREQGLPGIYNFLVARFARLYPLFFVCIAFDLTIKWSYQQLPPHTADALPYYLTLTHSWFYRQFDGQPLVFLFGWMPQVSWSISVEWFFYLVFPLICLALTRVKTLRLKWALFALTALAGAATIIAIGIHSKQISAFGIAHFGATDYFGSSAYASFLKWIFAYSPYTRLFEFAMGCLVADIVVKMSVNPPDIREQRIGLWILIATIVMTLLIHFFYGALRPKLHEPFQVIKYLQHSIGYGLPLAIIIFCCARYTNAITRSLSTKYLVLCGEISYSIYMLHMLIIGAFRWEAATATTREIGVAGILRLIVVIAATIGLSLVTYTLIEMPAKKWLTRTLRIRSKADMTVSPAI